jgi:hypothetical protein
MGIDNMMYITFNQEGWLLSATNLMPEDMDNVFEVEDSLLQGQVVLGEDGIPRNATEEEISERNSTFLLESTKRQIRFTRDKLLLDSDKLVLPDLWNSYTEAKKTAVSEYRQALRDLPLQEGFPLEVVWPELSI